MDDESYWLGGFLYAAKVISLALLAAIAIVGSIPLIVWLCGGFDPDDDASTSPECSDEVHVERDVEFVCAKGMLRVPVPGFSVAICRCPVQSVRVFDGGFSQ